MNDDVPTLDLRQGGEPFKDATAPEFTDQFDECPGCSSPWCPNHAVWLESQRYA